MRLLGLALSASLALANVARADSATWEHGHKRKVAGVALILVGSAFAFAGQVVLAYAAAHPVFSTAECPAPPHPCDNHPPVTSWLYVAPGAASLGLGTLLIGAGIPVYVAGGVEERRALGYGVSARW